MLSNSSGMQIYENHLLVWYSPADCLNSLTDVIPDIRIYTSVYILALFKSQGFWGLSLSPVTENGNSLSAQWSQFLPLPHSPLNVRCWAGTESLTHDFSAAASFLWIRAAAAPVGWVPESLLLPPAELQDMLPLRWMDEVVRRVWLDSLNPTDEDSYGREF